MTSEHGKKDELPAKGKPPQVSAESTVQAWIKNLILIGFVLFFFVYFFYVLHGILTGNWIAGMISDHPAATVVLAFAALVAFFVVLLLQYSTGQIRFKAPGFEFEGASGPIVLWIMCFLALATAIKWLWGE